ncbi:DEP domain-containing protein 1A isoform X1 [Ictalurus punctatus]|uniref:DEP domain-containing protein 1A isoform X1 n=1 Tax=Ictalurus punctatus TaxID=7998 RepID=A0A2D0QXG9_ICTPU|nr:DEP domain-containing protein 1A isoform X1 [Ictalurus punctatus]
MDSHIITPGPYRATKLWNEVTKLFRAGMPVKKHRQHLKAYPSCFTATSAVDWLHDLLRHNCNFGPEVTRQQTVQLLKKFLKNHVIEDVKGRWGMEDLEDNSQLYRFPPTSPLKPIPAGSQGTRKKSLSLKDRESFFKLRGARRFDKEIQENVAPTVEDTSNGSPTEEDVHYREITEEEILDIWKNVTLTHLQKLLGLPSLEDVLNPAEVNSHFIVYNMTKVNKHGVVTLEDKTDDLPHWVLSAMKCLANWPKFDQPSYTGFERDVFKSVSDYFHSLPQPMLTFQYYELFVNVLVLCGYATAPSTQRGKRKNLEELSCPQPAKAPHLNSANAFRSTECLLLSLIRKESFEETESPMKEVFATKIKTQFASSRARSNGRLLNRFPHRSSSLERILDESADSCPKWELFRSAESLASFRTNSTDNSSPQGSSPADMEPKPDVSSSMSCNTSPSETCPSIETSQSNSSSSSYLSEYQPTCQRTARPRPRSIGNCLDILEHREMSASCFSINAPIAEITMRPDLSSSTVNLRGPGLVRLHGSCLDVSTGPSNSRRCHSTLDLCKPVVQSRPSMSSVARRLSPEQSLLQPALERLAIEALQLCTLLLPPGSRRKLQLLLRMISRMSQNVDMPRLHDTIGTRTLMVQTFSRCVLSCEEEVDLDELLATRLLSFLMDHHQEVLQVPMYLRIAVEHHIAYLRSQTRHPLQTYSFCKQISTQEFEEQKLSLSQAAVAELLESIIKDKCMSVKEKKKKLRLFQKEYPDIYSRRFPTTESEAQLFADKPKIKPPMLIGIRKAKTFSIRN